MRSILSSIGIGAATVDTVFPSTTVTAGEPVPATVEIEGGQTDQAVDAVYLALETYYNRDEGRSVGVIHRQELTDGFTIAAGGERALDVTIEIPYETPVTYGDVQVWVDTGLDIDNAIDPDDTDQLSVEPDRDLATLLDAVDGLGFDLAGVRVLSAELVPFDTHCGFVQEFEYRPAGGEFAGTLDDVELLAHPTPGGVETVVEVDRRGDPLSGRDAVDERTARLDVGDGDVDAVAEEVGAIVDRLA